MIRKQIFALAAGFTMVATGLAGLTPASASAAVQDSAPPVRLGVVQHRLRFHLVRCVQRRLRLPVNHAIITTHNHPHTSSFAAHPHVPFT